MHRRLGSVRGGLGDGYGSKWMCGHVRVRFDKSRVVCHAENLNVGELLGDKPPCCGSLVLVVQGGIDFVKPVHAVSCNYHGWQ